MSKGGRLGLIALALIALVGAFVIISPGDDDGDGDNSGQAAQTTPTATAPSATTPPPDAVLPPPTKIALTDHAAAEVADIDVKKGERVRFVVTSDLPDEIHVHGYDIEQEVGPGKPARFSFPASIEGIFEIESHEAEHAGKDALIARLTVEPS
jgi:heme/copper-type cytochrome/quinol oxidase subunit 2